MRRGTPSKLILFFDGGALRKRAEHDSGYSSDVSANWITFRLPTTRASAVITPVEIGRRCS